MLQIVSGSYAHKGNSSIKDLEKLFIKVRFVSEVQIDGANTIVFSGLVNDDFVATDAYIPLDSGLVIYKLQAATYTHTTHNVKSKLRKACDSEEAKIKRLKKQYRKIKNQTITVKNWKQFTKSKSNVIKTALALGVAA